MSNQVEQIRAEVERRKNYISVTHFANELLDFIDSLPTKENPILVPESKETTIEIAGKKVVVRYTKDGHPCEKCVLDGTKGCNSTKCSLLDRVGMEIDERAYFVEAEQPISIGVDTWFQQLKIGDKVETYDGRIETIRKKYDDSFMLGFDAEGRKNCAPDGYFPIAVSGCRPFVVQPSSIAPEADLEAEAERFLKTLPWRTNTPPIPDEYLDEKTYLAIARHFAEWGAEHLKR